MPSIGSIPPRDVYDDIGAGATDTSSGNFPLTLTDLGGLQYTGLLSLVNPSAFEAGAPNFNLSQSGVRSFTNWVGATYTDHVTFLGDNSNAQGGRENLTLPSFQLAFESKFWSPGSRSIYAQEFGMRFTSETGVEFRPYDSYIPYDGMGMQQAYVSDLWSIEQAITRSNVKAQFFKAEAAPARSVTWFKVAATGTASGATTNSAGYAAGVTQVTLAAAGSGSLPAGCPFQFDGAGITYFVDTTIADVAVGGTLVFWPPLTALLSAAPHTVVRTTAPSAVQFHQSNNIATTYQRNAADSAYLPYPYFDASNEFVLNGVTGQMNASSPAVFKAKASSATFVWQAVDSADNVMFAIGGIVNTTNGQGRGWFRLNNQIDASGAGYELMSGAAGVHTYKENLSSGGVFQMLHTPSGASPKFEIRSNNEIRLFPNSTGSFFEFAAYRLLCSFPIQLPNYTVAQLNALAGRVFGYKAFCNDALAPAWNAAVVGGGAVKCPVWYDGTNWIVG